MCCCGCRVRERDLAGAGRSDAAWLESGVREIGVACSQYVPTALFSLHRMTHGIIEIASG
jgi:hypothetical protein